MIVKTYEHNGLTVDVSFTGDAFFNATVAAKAFDKLPKNWLVTNDAQEYIEACSRNMLLDKNQMVIVKMGAPENGGGTWLHPKLAVVFARWVNVDFALWCDGIIESILKGATSQDRPQPQQSITQYENALRLVPPAMDAVKALFDDNEIRLDNNALRLSANQLVITATGINVLAAMGHAQLASETQKLHYTPTEIGQMLNPPLSAIKTNVALAAVGLQTKVAGRWTPTDQGKPHAMIVDTTKRHNSGIPVEQVKWAADVISILNQGEVA
jgi:hypothetical protein